MNTSENAFPTALGGLKVLEISSMVSAPFCDKLLTQLELKLGLKKKIGLELLIEETLGMQNVEEIAASTPRLEAMIFGMGDYSASQGLDFTSGDQEDRHVEEKESDDNSVGRAAAIGLEQELGKTSIEGHAMDEAVDADIACQHGAA